MCDPVIDEHFRRSLGERYTHLFAPAATERNSNGSNESSSGVTGGSSSSSSSSAAANMASTVSVTGLSVDDHFAKALGETWLKLQNETSVSKESGKEESATVTVAPASVVVDSTQPGSPLPAKQRHGLLLT